MCEREKCLRERRLWGSECLQFFTGECLRANKSRSDQEVDNSKVGNTNTAFNMLNVCHMKTDKRTSKMIRLMDTKRNIHLYAYVSCTLNTTCTSLSPVGISEWKEMGQMCLFWQIYCNFIDPHMTAVTWPASTGHLLTPHYQKSLQIEDMAEKEREWFRKRSIYTGKYIINTEQY